MAIEKIEGTVSADAVLKLLRQLPPGDRLQVIASALPEATQELLERAIPVREPRRPLRGLWKGFEVDLSADDIDAARKEAWANFPREDV